MALFQDDHTDSVVIEALELYDHLCKFAQDARWSTDAERELALLKRSFIQSALAKIEDWNPGLFRNPDWSEDTDHGVEGLTSADVGDDG